VKTLAKLIMLLAVLAICMPAYGQGDLEILIYAQTHNCWEAWEVEDNGFDWRINKEHITGFLVLMVVYDSETGEIIAIEDAEQIEYWRDGRDKWYEQFDEGFIIERVDVGDEVIWVLEQLDGDSEPNPWGGMLMIRGRARDMNIGLGRDEKREVARVLNGYILYIDLGMGIEKSMCTMSIRLLKRWTGLANEYFEAYKAAGGVGFDYDPFVWAIGGPEGDDTYGIVKAWLIRRGYEETIPD